MNDKNHQTWGSNSKVVQRTQHPKLEQRVQNGILSKEKRASISSSFPSLQMCVDNVNTNFSDLPLGKPLTRFSVVSRYCKRLKMNMLYLYTYAYIYIHASILIFMMNHVCLHFPSIKLYDTQSHNASPCAWGGGSIKPNDSKSLISVPKELTNLHMYLRNMYTIIFR